MKRLRFWAIILIVTYIFSGIIRAAHNPSGAHGQRQVDTLGMSVMLAKQVKAEQLHGLIDGILYPRILESGLSSGINVTEFPLLNILTFPFFYLGTRAGVFLCSLFVLLVNSLAAFYFLPRLWRAWKIDLPVWVAVLTYFSIPSIEFQTSIFMPEGLGLPLLILGATYFSERKWLGSWIFLTLAVAVKPPFVTAFLPLALYPFFRPRKNFFPFWVVLALALLFPAWWYTFHAQEILLRAQNSQIFAALGFHPLPRLLEVGFIDSLKLIFRQISVWHFPVYFGLVLYPALLWFEPALAFILIPMLVGAIALLGGPIWVHFYYFVGASFLALILMGRALSLRKNYPWLRTIALIAVFWGVVFGIRNNVWVSSRTDDWWSLAAPFTEAMPKGTLLVTDDVALCPTKLLRVGHPGTLAPDDFALICRKVGYRDHPITFFLDQENYDRERKVPGNCLSETKTLLAKSQPFVSWVLLSWTPKAKTIP